MIQRTLGWATLAVLVLAARTSSIAADDEIVIPQTAWQFNAKPTPINISGFSGEVDQVLKFDLGAMGFVVVPAGTAGCNWQLTGSNNGRVEAHLTDLVSKEQKLGKAYTGGTLRQQTHALADDVVQAIRHEKGIAQTKIAFKLEKGGNGEICIADYDGFNAQPMTRDNVIVAAPEWVPGRMALFYTSYKFGNPDVFYHNLSTGERKAIAQYGGSNMSPAPSPDGRHVAMVLSKDGWTDLYVANADGSGLRRLTTSREDESSPCWSPDGQWICFATKIKDRRTLCKIPAAGGEMQRIVTSGVPSPTEPDWSPDGKWIAFTSQRGGGFDICVVPAAGGEAKVLVEGEDPSWAPNSRNLIFGRRAGSTYALSVLDVPTKQEKTLRRISGSCSQPSWAR